MGLLDDALKQLTQSNQSQPALTELLQDLLQGKSPGNGAPPSAPQAAAPQTAPQPADSGAPDGLAGLLAKLEAAGLGDQVKSWIGTGQNEPVAPADLGSALGKTTVTKMADQAGVNQEDLLSQLAKALPVLIDKLTADGRVPGQSQGSSARPG